MLGNQESQLRNQKSQFGKQESQLGNKKIQLGKKAINIDLRKMLNKRKEVRQEINPPKLQLWGK